MGKIVGVDFDNTLINYDEVLFRTAVEQGLISVAGQSHKKDIRDMIRSLPGGEILWQKLQAMVYGPRIQESQLIDGVIPFFQMCHRHDLKIYVVSHKTEFARRDETGTNLRSAALSWMDRQGFFKKKSWGITTEQVYFESTREAKIGRIRQLGCTHFIDDLEETFLDESFPEHVRKILYAPHCRQTKMPGVKICTSWQQIQDYFHYATD